MTGVTIGMNVDFCRAEIVGGANTPYDGGLFTLEIKIPNRWGLLNRRDD